MAQLASRLASTSSIWDMAVSNRDLSPARAAARADLSAVFSLADRFGRSAVCGVVMRASRASIDSACCALAPAPAKATSPNAKRPLPMRFKTLEAPYQTA